VRERPAAAQVAAESQLAQERERRAGGPQDQALFVCRCGSAFQADVTASVRCPHCGESQAW
jgi:rubrerythrin